MKKEEKTEITRNKIFTAAMHEFGTKGYALGAINNICKTGINKGLIYHNFKDKDALYLECVKKSCSDLIGYVMDHNGLENFARYMRARKEFFQEKEAEAYIFLEARTNPPGQLRSQIQEIYREFDELNRTVCEKELSKHTLREGVSKEEAMEYFSEIQKLYNLNFAKSLQGELSLRDQVSLHEMNIYKIIDLMLYGVAKGEEEK